MNKVLLLLVICVFMVVGNISYASSNCLLVNDVACQNEEKLNKTLKEMEILRNSCSRYIECLNDNGEDYCNSSYKDNFNDCRKLKMLY